MSRTDGKIDRHSQLVRSPEALDAYAALTVALLEAPDGSVPCQEEPDGFTADRAEERAQAAILCQSCPVLDLCAAYAETAKERFGIWGGEDRTR